MDINEKQIQEFGNAVAKAGAKIQGAAKASVRKKLFTFIGERSNEYVQIAEDFVGNAQISLLEGIGGIKTAKFQTLAERKARQQRMLALLNNETNFIQRYIHRSVINACNTRCKRWSNDVEANNLDAQFGDIEEAIEDRRNDDNKQYAIRSRSGRQASDFQTDEDWMAENSSKLRVDNGLEGVGEDNLQAFVEAKGLTQEEYDLIHSYLSGEKFEDIALQLNITKSACEKRYQRCVKKLGLTTKDLKFSTKKTAKA